MTLKPPFPDGEDARLQYLLAVPCRMPPIKKKTKSAQKKKNTEKPRDSPCPLHSLYLSISLQRVVATQTAEQAHAQPGHPLLFLVLAKRSTSPVYVDRFQRPGPATAFP